ncbi:cell division protein FtsZ, partial [Verminephrobacter sp. Larva24]
PGAMPGRLVLPASQPGAPPMLTLSYDTQAALADDPDQSALRDISLGLDVAQIDRTEQAFARLRDVAAALCEAMDGALCDQHGQPLPAMAMEPIAADLERLYDQLDGRDLSAGSALARRLFS